MTIIALLLFCGFSYLYVSFSSDGTIGDALSIGAWLGFMWAIAMLAYIVWAASEYNDLYKEVVLHKILKFFGFKPYGTEKLINDKTLKKSAIFAPFHGTEKEDSMTGKYKNVTLAISEVKTIYNNQNNNHERTIFSGLVIMCQFQRPFSGHTVVRKDAGKAAKLFDFFSKLKETRLEDPTFEKIFEVYTDDPIEARYLLPPDFMENIKSLSQTFSKGPVELSFFDDMLLIKVGIIGDFLEGPRLSQPLTSEAIYHKSLKEVHSILSVIDKLDIRPRTLKKKK